jgi:hypothetical protein
VGACRGTDTGACGALLGALAGALAGALVGALLGAEAADGAPDSIWSHPVSVAAKATPTTGMASSNLVALDLAISTRRSRP